MNDQQPAPRLLGYKRVVCPEHLQRARQAALEAGQREDLGALLCEYQDGDRVVLRFEHGRRSFLKPNVYVTVPDYCR